MEGRWVYKIFSDICDQNKLEMHHKSRVLGLLGTLGDFYEGLGFCLSEHGDALSQWRGYAQNAEGFSVGFSKEGLQALSALSHGSGKPSLSLNKVNYDIHTQQKELEPTYHEIKKLIDQGAFRVPTLLTIEESEEKRKKAAAEQKEALNNIYLHILFMFPKLFQQKNPAFSEEKEWRIVSPYIKNTDDDIEFRAAGYRITPYRIFEFQSENGIIDEVILGPKNQTPIDIIQAALKKFGYKSVTVRKSEATYR